MHSAVTAWEISRRNHVKAIVLFKSRNGKPMGSLHPSIQDEAWEYYCGDEIFDDLRNYFLAMIDLWSDKFATEDLRRQTNEEDDFNACFSQSKDGPFHYFPWWRLANEEQYLLDFIDLMRES
jgi:hypothetical protein